MGSGMMDGCISLGSARRTRPVVAGSTSGAARTLEVVASWRCWRLVLVILGWVRVKFGRAWSGTMPTVHRWRLLVIRRRPGSLMSVLSSPSLPMSGQVWVRKATSDLALITMPNISGCSSVLSTQVSATKERMDLEEWR